MLLLFAVCSVCLASAIFAPGNAAAYLQSDWFSTLPEDQQQAIVDFEYQHGPQGVTPYSGGPADTATTLTNTLADEPTSASFFGDLVSKVTATVEETGLIPLVTKAVPYIAVAGTGFAAGWEIGTGIHAIFVKLGLGDDSASGGSSDGQGDFCYTQACGGRLEYYPTGYVIYNNATVEQATGAYIPAGRLNGSFWPLVRWFEAPCGFSGYSPPNGAHLQTGVSAGVDCWTGSLHPIYVDYPYVLPSELFGQGVLHPYDPNTDGTPTDQSTAPADPGTSAVASSTESSLDSEGNQLQQAWLSWALEPESLSEEDPAQSGAVAPPRGPNDKCTPKSAPDPYDPGENPPGYSGSLPEAQVMSTYSAIDNPFGGGATDVKLFWGNQGFGLRHIQRRHGWGSDDDTATGVALTDPDAMTVDPNDATTELYYRYYTGTDGSTQCTRLVVVQWSTNRAPKWPTTDNPEPKYIITSFARPTAGDDPTPGTGL